MFNTPTPQPAPIQVININADLEDEQSYQTITSNNPDGFMEISSISPNTVTGPQKVATSTTLDDNNEPNHWVNRVQLNENYRESDEENKHEDF